MQPFIPTADITRALQKDAEDALGRLNPTNESFRFTACYDSEGGFIGYTVRKHIDPPIPF